MFNFSESLLGNIIQIIIVVVISYFYVRILLKRDCRWTYIFAYSFRIVLLFFSVFGRNIGCLPFDGGDTEYFYSAVWERADHKNYGIDFLVTFTAYLSYIFGDSRLLYQYMMTMISMLGIRLTDKSMIRLDIKREIRRICMFVIAIAPSFAMFNIIYSREAIVMTCIIGSFYLFLNYLKSDGFKKKAIFLISAFIVGLLACPLHGAPVAVMGGYIFAIIFYEYKKDSFGVNWRSLVAGGVILLTLIILYNCTDFIFQKLGGITNPKTIAARFMYEGNLAAGSSYAQYVGDSDTWGRFVMYTPVRIFYGMYAPWPWEWRGLADIATFFGNSVFYIIVSLIAIIDVFRKKTSNLFRWLVFTLCIVSTFVGWGCVAFGTAIRHRDKFFPLFIILMALELQGKKNREMIASKE